MPHTRQSYFGHRPTHSTCTSEIRSPRNAQPRPHPDAAAAPHTVLAATARVVVRSSTCRTWRDGTRVQSDLVPIINKNADRVSATHTIPRYRSTMTQNIRHNSYRFGPQQSQWLVPRASVYTMVYAWGQAAGRAVSRSPSPRRPRRARARARHRASVGEGSALGGGCGTGGACQGAPATL